MIIFAVVGAPWGIDAMNRARAMGDESEEWHMVAAWPEVLESAFQHGPRPRYAFFLNWSHLVPQAIVDGWECVNFHCTPLPYGRGGHPIENLLLRDHTQTVVTAHRMTTELDAGPIYGQRGPISLVGSKSDIQLRFIDPCADLMRHIINHKPVPQPQVGDPVLFSRLAPDAYRQFWEARQ